MKKLFNYVFFTQLNTHYLTCKEGLIIEYSRIYTLRNGLEKSIKVESWRSFREEMNVLGIQDSDVFQIQLVEYGKERTKKSSPKNNRRK
ncbi:hypothetical protein BN2127_JRS1_02591 [Bacillus cereus]|nr:hypothetical protein BN2127_JRS1_02591 [Bacillus cereus]